MDMGTKAASHGFKIYSLCQKLSIQLSVYVKGVQNQSSRTDQGIIRLVLCCFAAGKVSA